MLAVFFLCAVLLAFGWLKRQALRGELRKLRTEYQKVREENSALQASLATIQNAYEGMRQIAFEAVRATAKHAKLNPDELLPRGGDVYLDGKTYIGRISPPPEVKFCSCNVSIRSDVWPVSCPACGKMVGDDENWPSVIGNDSPQN